MTMAPWIVLAMLGSINFITIASTRMPASGTWPTLPFDAVSDRKTSRNSVTLGFPHKAAEAVVSDEARSKHLLQLNWSSLRRMLFVRWRSAFTSVLDRARRDQRAQH